MKTAPDLAILQCQLLQHIQIENLHNECWIFGILESERSDIPREVNEGLGKGRIKSHYVMILSW